MRFESIAPFDNEVEADEESVFVVVVVDQTVDIFCKEVVKLLFVKLSCLCLFDYLMAFLLSMLTSIGKTSLPGNSRILHISTVQISALHISTVQVSALHISITQVSAAQIGTS